MEVDYNFINITYFLSVCTFFLLCIKISSFILLTWHKLFLNIFWNKSNTKFCGGFLQASDLAYGKKYMKFWEENVATLHKSTQTWPKKTNQNPQMWSCLEENNGILWYFFFYIKDYLYDFLFYGI